MSAPTLDKISEPIHTALLDAVWAQWRSLGMGAGGDRQCRAIIDPEALVFGSLWLQEVEPRLGKILRMWAAAGSRLVSVQRTRNLSPAYPEAVQARLSIFARDALLHGKDSRWKLLVTQRESAAHDGWKAARTAPVLAAPASLLLRLRVGMGVGIKADLFSFLLGTAGGRHTVTDIAGATHYFNRAVRRAVEEMVAARFVDAVPTAPATYYVRSAPWATVLQLPEDLPLWRYWQEMFAFGAALDAAAREARGESRYLQSSRARDLIEQHHLAFDLNTVPLSVPHHHPGEDYLAAFHQDVSELSRRVTSNFV